jgi:hypothetical protein
MRNRSGEPVESPAVDVRIGLVHSLRELELELPDDTDGAALRSQVEAALADDDAILWLVDRKGATFGISAEKITFIQLGTAEDKGRIGFG